MQAMKLLESMQRGSTGFPIELYRIDHRHPRYVMPRHWHDECELILVRSGRFDYEIGPASEAATAGDMLFVNSGQLHGGMPQNCVYECIVFHLELLMHGNDAARPLLAPIAEGSRQVRLRLPADDIELAAVVRRLFEILAARRPGYVLQTQGLMYQLFGRVVERGYFGAEAGDAGGTRKKLGQLKNALSLIEREYDNPLTLGQLARAAGMSPKYFCHVFQEVTRRTPIDYLNHHRIEVARTLLASGAANATEVAYECGFNDLSYFIRVFKRYTGVTPKQYGREARQ